MGLGSLRDSYHYGRMLSAGSKIRGAQQGEDAINVAAERKEFKGAAKTSQKIAEHLGYHQGKYEVGALAGTGGSAGAIGYSKGKKRKKDTMSKSAFGVEHGEISKLGIGTVMNAPRKVLTAVGDFRNGLSAGSAARATNKAAKANNAAGKPYKPPINTSFSETFGSKAARVGTHMGAHPAGYGAAAAGTAGTAGVAGYAGNKRGKKSAYGA